MFFGLSGSRFTAALFAVVVFLCGTGESAFAAEGDACDLDGGSGSGEIILDGSGNERCVASEAAAAFHKCRGAGWGAVVFQVIDVIAILCQIPVRDFADGADAEEVNSCGISGGPTRPCSDIFGAELNFPESDESGGQRFIYNCPEHMGADPAYVSGGVQGCVPLSARGVCAALFGGGEKDEGGGRVCSGVDAAGTFCIVGSRDAFPCRGLFRHVWRCNREHHRPAENPFICAARCDEDTEVAKGAECECAEGYAKQEEGGPCAASE